MIVIPINDTCGWIPVINNLSGIYFVAIVHCIGNQMERERERKTKGKEGENKFVRAPFIVQKFFKPRSSVLVLKLFQFPT
jgi:hypothetical protein